VVPQGQMTMEKLIEPRPAAFGSISFYLRFIEALNLAGAARCGRPSALRRQIGNISDPHLAGCTRRLRPRPADGLFSFSFLAEGPGTRTDMAAAERDYNANAGRTPEQGLLWTGDPPGRWTVLQYWFFYYSNPWRFSVPWCQRPRVPIGRW